MTGARLLVVLTILIATMCAGIVFATGESHAVVIWTARSSLVLFALAYVARPLTSLWPTPAAKWLLRERKWIGDGFAVSHFAHMIAIIVFATYHWDVFAAGRDKGVVLALLAYVLLFAMAITSIDRVRAAMSKRAWNVLHRTGMHVIWVVFIGSYAKRLSTSAIGPIGVGVLGTIAAVRFAAWLRARRRARARVSVAA